MYARPFAKDADKWPQSSALNDASKGWRLSIRLKAGLSARADEGGCVEVSVN